MGKVRCNVVPARLIECLRVVRRFSSMIDALDGF